MQPPKILKHYHAWLKNYTGILNVLGRLPISKQIPTGALCVRRTIFLYVRHNWEKDASSFLSCNPLCASINQQTESRTIQWCVSERMGGLCLGKRPSTHVLRKTEYVGRTMQCYMGKEDHYKRRWWRWRRQLKGAWRKRGEKNRWRAVKYGEHCYVSYPRDCGHPRIWFCHNSRYVIAVAAADLLLRLPDRDGQHQHRETEKTRGKGGRDNTTQHSRQHRL